MKKNKNTLPIIEFILAVSLICLSIGLLIWKALYLKNNNPSDFDKISFAVQIGLLPWFGILEYIAIKDFVELLKTNKKQPNK